MSAPERVRWAVDVLDPGPGDHILEIGGGPGISAALICERLSTGQLLAVDRSAVAIQRTRQRNCAHLATGRLAVQLCAFDELSLPPLRFDKALALNVNLFWTKRPDRELALLSRALRPNGILHILYGAAGPTSASRITDSVSTALRANGFVDLVIRHTASGFGVTACSPP